MLKYLGELDDEDLIMFVLEHLKDHKPPAKLIEGLEPVCHSSYFAKAGAKLFISLQVLEEEATELVVSLWRQIIFESTAYNEGLLTEKMLVD